ncbi:DUF2441 domain-containing protein [Chryseobacterium gleum]|uniref:DUF2441 domain-containing protein n=1 Tax=Chryseobacterium gleum TaxID=250 RepID=UPI00289D43B9|nr:DUF2441 domain-containing protein [Chryseobacterium gleum]
MEVKDEIFYHIQKKGSYGNEWVIKNKFYWNSRPNKFIETLFGIDLRIPYQNKMVPYRQAYEKNFTGFIKSDNMELINFFNFSNFALNKNSMMLRELILENYRKDNFPELPSRYNSIWVCKEDNLDYWIKALQINDYNVFQLKLTGVMHISTEKSLYSDVLNVHQYQELAKKYWSQDQVWENDSEALFDGLIEIITIK